MTAAVPSAYDMMQGLSVTHLRFRVRATEALLLEGQAGSALRGALYNALSQNFCSEPEGPHTLGHQDRCPVCWLLAQENDTGRGKDIPRPLNLQPPVARIYRRGEGLQFGISLVGAAQNLLPYVARAVQKAGALGLGRGRGQFVLEEIGEYNPLLDAYRRLMDGRRVSAPTLQVTPARIEELLPATLDGITLEFITPTRLTADGVLVKQPQPGVLLKRLVERCQSIVTHYAEVEQPPARDAWVHLDAQLSTLAESWQVAFDETAWSEQVSGSRRHGRLTPISGFVGRVRYHGDIRPALPWLLWGQSLHVGKSAVKGNGWYRALIG